MRFGRAFSPSKNVFLSFLPTSLHMIGSMAHGYGFLSPSTHGPCFFYIQSTICKLRCYHAILKHLVHLHVSQKLMYGRKTSINGSMVRCYAISNDELCQKLPKILFCINRLGNLCDETQVDGDYCDSCDDYDNADDGD